MLVFLAFFALTIGGIVYAIMPMYLNFEEAREELARIEDAWAQQTMLLASEAGIRAANEQAYENFNEAAEQFLLEAHASEIGRMMIALLSDHGLTSLDQRLFEPVINGDIATIETAMSLQGSYDNLKRLFDTIENTPYIRITRLSFSVSSENPSWLNNVSINFEVAMIR